MFDQSQYLLNAGNQSVEWPERIVPFIQRVMDTWTDVFQGQMQRLVRVVGGQHYWPDVSRRISLNMHTGSFDAFTPAAYIGFGEYGDSVITAQGSALTPQRVLELARREMDLNALPLLQELKETICDVRNVQLVYYEGGQHLTPNPFGSIQPYNQALEDAQSLPEMYTLYNDWLTRLRALTANSLFMNFSFASSKNGRYGSWGVLEYVGQSINDAPKYRALIDNLCGSPSVSVPHKTLRPGMIQLEQNYPNPFNPETVLKFYIASAGKVKLIIYDMLGKEIAHIFDGDAAAGWHTILWKSSNLASGLYVCTLHAGDARLTKKILLLK
jgi:hypothetical protein